MTDLEILQKFVQSVYLTRYGRYIDDITNADGLAEIAKTLSWTNDFIEELEVESDWKFSREMNKTIGTIAATTDTFSLAATDRKLVTDEDRPLAIMQGDVVVSQWEVVDPDQITRRESMREKRVTVVKGNLIFSRPFTDYEVGGEIIADVINYLPELSETDISLLSIVKPKSLLKLGVAKNATLPDIVQGGLSPSFVQKYNDLLEKTKEQNEQSATAGTYDGEDFSGIGMS